MKKVLLIDDDPVFSSIVRQASEAYGYKVESVLSFRKLKNKNLEGFDGFWVDYDLGDGTGDQVIEWLDERKIDRPIALISATDHFEAKHSPHPYTFVSKWQDTESFFKAMKKAI